MVANDFDWNEGADVVVARKAAVAVHPNANGDIVIRQEADLPGGNDIVIIIGRENARRLIRRIELLCADEPSE